MDILLDVKGQVKPICSKSHISYWFELPDKVETLHLIIKYSPKKLEDKLKAKPLIIDAIGKFIEEEHQEAYLQKWESYLPLQNLLTLSVDDPVHSRGAAHRHDPEQHLYISELDASPGLVAGTLIPGQWRVTISLHAIVTEICDYSLQVCTGGKDNDALGSERITHTYVSQ